jgi:hypothetical protein
VPWGRMITGDTLAAVLAFQPVDRHGVTIAT